MCVYSYTFFGVSRTGSESIPNRGTRMSFKGIENLLENNNDYVFTQNRAMIRMPYSC